MRQTASIVAAAALALAAGAAPAYAAHAQRIAVDAQRCALGWRAPNPSRTSFRVVNDTGVGGTVYLVRPLTNRIAATVKNLPPHGARRLVVRMKPGTYQWSCDLNGRAVVTSDSAIVPVNPTVGQQLGGRPLPVSYGELAVPRDAYRTFVTHTLTTLQGQLGALAAAEAPGTGSLAAAEQAWLTAHLTWHRIGAAYGAFGALGTAIDGSTAGLPGAAADPNFTGFHRVELDLWRRADLAAAQADTAQLAGFVAKLATAFPHDQIAVNDVPLRAHEILEDAARDELTATDDDGSGTDLATVTADVDGTRTLLHLLAPLLPARAPALIGRAEAQLTRLDAAIEATRTASGGWVAVDRLPQAQREAVDAAIGAALETLARLPLLLHTGIRT